MLSKETIYEVTASMNLKNDTPKERLKAWQQFMREPYIMMMWADDFAANGKQKIADELNALARVLMPEASLNLKSLF